MAYHIFDYGPTGRHILVDDDGRLIVNGDASESGHIYAYGDTGFPLLVDGAGRLLINPSGLVGSGGGGAGADARLDAVPWTSGGRLVDGDYANRWVWFKGSMFAPRHNWLGATDDGLLKITPSGNTFATKKIAAPSGGYPWVVKVVGERLFVGHGEGSDGYISYSDDGETLNYAIDMPGTAQVTALGEYDGQLIIGHNKNTGTEHPIYKLNIAEGDPPTFSIEEAFDIYAYAGNWGWDYGLDVCANRVFTFTNIGSILNVYDGLHNLGEFWPDPYDATETRPTALAIEYNGEIFLLGTNIYKYQEMPTDTVNNPLVLAKETYEDTNGTVNACAAVYNNKLWIIDTAHNIYTYDGHNWTVDTSMSGVANGTRGGLIQVDDKLYYFTSDKVWWSMRDALYEPNNNAGANSKFRTAGVRHVKGLMDYCGARFPTQTEVRNDVGSGVLSPEYTSVRFITQSTPLASGLSELDGQVYGEKYDLIPDTTDTYNIGSQIYAFKGLHAASGFFTQGIRVEASGDQAAIEIHSDTGTRAIEIINDGDAILLDLQQASGAANPVIKIENPGSGYDIQADNWNVDYDGNADFNNIPKVYRTTVGEGDWNLPSGGYYWADIIHNLGQQYVIAQFYDLDTNQSSGVSIAHEHRDGSTLRVFTTTSGDIGAVIMG
jgi:hypothetical protein